MVCARYFLFAQLIAKSRHNFKFDSPEIPSGVARPAKQPEFQLVLH